MPIFSWPGLQAAWVLVLPWLCGAFIAATLLQLALWWGVFFRNWTRLIREQRTTSNRTEAADVPAVSVIICARNEAVNLHQYLPAILQQNYAGPWEVLVVDDASTDETVRVLADFQKMYAHLAVLALAEKPSPGKKNALQQGIQAARYEQLVFTDADCHPATPFWLKTLIETLAANPATEIVLAYGPTRPQPGFLNAWVRFETVHTALQYFSLARAGCPYMGVGRNLAWKRPVFQRIGGFDSHLDLASGDDDLFINQAARAGNTAVCLDPATFVFSEGKTKWRDWFRQKRRHITAGLRYRRTHQFMLGLTSLSHAGHYLLLLLLILAGYQVPIVIGFYLLRLIAVWAVYRKVLAALQEKGLLPGLPVYDGMMALYYGVFIPWSWLRSGREVGWK